VHALYLTPNMCLANNALRGPKVDRVLVLKTNDSVVKVLGDETLKAAAGELVDTVQCNVTMSRTIHQQYGYPPVKQERVIQKVLEQAEI